MECLKDILCGRRVIIGIKDFNNCNTPESGLFINDIPGITLKSAAAIAYDEHRSGYEFLQNITKRAVQLVFEEFYSAATSRFQLHAVSETREVKAFDGTTLPPANLDRGLVVKRWRSEIAQINIEYLFVKVAQSGTVSISIIDGDHTEIVTATVVANVELPIRVDYIAKSESVRIVMNDSSYNVYSGAINRTAAGCQTCSGNWNGNGLYVAGWDGSQENSTYYGIGVLASVRCYEENILCMLLKRMSFLFWYKAGIMYYEELQASNRLNPITIYTKDKAQDNIDNLTKKYNDSFKNFIPTIQDFILSTKGECFSCNPSIRNENRLSV